MSFEPDKPDLFDYAVVDADGLVVNVVLWNGEDTDWTPPDGCTLVALPYFTEDDGYRRYTGGIGWTYNPKATKNKWIAPPEPEEPTDGAD